MLDRCSAQILVASFLVVFGSRNGNTEDRVPDWFRSDAATPHAIFDAWKELSTRKSLVCLGENWEVLAGQLQNELGEPIPNSPITICHDTVIRGYSVTLQTDERGHFIVYSPYTLQLGPRNSDGMNGALDGCFVSATPGFPNSQPGQAFAYKCKATRQCQSRLVQREGERAYYILTCDDQTGFNRDDFEKFESEYFAQKIRPRDGWRDRIKEPEGKPSGVVRYYDVQVADEADNGVPNALVKYQLSGLMPGFQSRVTDKEGRCKIEEWPPEGERIYRILTIDAPGFGVGPVPFELKADVANVIRLPKPATAVGRIVDDANIPLSTRLRVLYKRLNTIAFETTCYSQADGTFQYDRIMPNEDFRVVSDGFDIRWHQKASVRSDWMSLKPGGVSQELKLQVVQASALRGVIVSDDGIQATASDIALDFGPREDFPGNYKRSYVGTNNGPWGSNDGRFGFYGLDSRPFRIRVVGWEVEPSEPIRLEPGEMRFVRVVLKTKLPIPRGQ